MKKNIWKNIEIISTIILAILTFVLICVTIQSIKATNRVVDLSEKEDFREEINLGANLINELDDNYVFIGQHISFLENMGGNEEILSNGLRDFSYMQTIEKVDFVSVGLRVRLMKYHDRIRHAGDVMEAIIHNNQNKEYKSQDVEKLKQVFDLLLDENDSSSVSSIRRDLFGYINNLSISYVETYGSWDD